MKILVTGFDYMPRLGGVAKCAHEMAKGLADQPGVELLMVAPSSENPETDAQFDASNSFRTVRLKVSRWPELAIIPLTFATAKILREWKPDLVVDTLWLPCSISTRLALLLCGSKAKQAILVHGVEVMESRQTLRKTLRSLLSFIKKSVFRSATFVMPVSRFTASLVHDGCGVRRKEILQIFNGVNLKNFFVAPPSIDRRKLGVDGKKILYTLTRLEEYKGIDFVLNALALVKKDFSEFKYLIGGVGPDRARLEKMSADLGLSQHVVFLGKVPDEELRDYYNLCDLFILNSRVDWRTPNVEGFGLVYLEAAACGKASLAPNIGGPVDVVESGTTGLLVDPEDENSISQALLTLLRDPTQLTTMGTNARVRAERDFTWDKATRLIVERARQCAE